MSEEWNSGYCDLQRRRREKKVGEENHAWGHNDEGRVWHNEKRWLAVRETVISGAARSRAPVLRVFEREAALGYIVYRCDTGAKKARRRDIEIVVVGSKRKERGR